MSATGHRALLAIVESLPTHPTSGQILGALVRAERAGFERGFHAATHHAATHHAAATQDLVLSTFLRRQAD